MANSLLMDSDIGGIIVQSLVLLFADRIRVMWKMSETANALKTEMDDLKSVRDLVRKRIAYAEIKQKMARRHTVGKWLKEVQAREKDLAEIEEYISQDHLGCCGVPDLVTRYKFSKKIIECLRAVEELNKTGDFDVVAYPVAEEDGDSIFVTAPTTEEDISLLQRGSPHRVGNHSTTTQAFMSELAKQRLRLFQSVELESYTSAFSTKLGDGGYAVVYKGVLPSKVQIAVKVFRNKGKEIIKEQFMAEVCTIGKTYHRNLVSLYGFCFDVAVKALVYEFMEKGSLDNLLFKTVPPIDWEKIPSIAIGIAKGLCYLHEDCRDRLVHYDIKPANILLDSNFCPKIADFGLAKFYDREITHVSGGRGTFGYAAPEVWIGASPVTYKCDVYSYGIMLFELVGRRKNKKHEQSPEWFPIQVWKKFEEGKVDELLVECGIPNECSERAQNMFMVALACIQQDPNDRPSMGTVVKILEGELKATKTPNPFQNLGYLYSSTSGDEGSRLARGGIRTNDNFSSPVMEQYEMTTIPGGLIDSDGTLFTPIMNKYEIEMASS